MGVICRLRVGTVEPRDWGTTVKLHALHSPDEVEDDETMKEIRSFFEATPSANFDMFIKNQAAEEQFQKGDEFYVRLEKIPTDQTVAAIYARKAKEYQEDKA